MQKRLGKRKGGKRLGKRKGGNCKGDVKEKGENRTIKNLTF